MLPKRFPTSGSFHMAHPSSPPIMEPSHVLPLRPVPKIQTMFSGLTPPCSPADDPRARGRRDLPLLSTRRQARLNLSANVVPPTPSRWRAGHKVIATISSQKTYAHAVGHYTLPRSRLAASASPVLVWTVSESTRLSSNL